jgi:Lon protease-like protein
MLITLHKYGTTHLTPLAERPLDRYLLSYHGVNRFTICNSWNFKQIANYVIRQHSPLRTQEAHSDMLYDDSQQ